MQRRRLLLPLIAILVAALGGIAASMLTDSSPELGLDLQGGVSVVLEPTEQADVNEGQMDVALEIIRTRVDALGVAEPEIVRQGDAIVVQLPGVENRDRVLDLVGQTAELRFRPVLASGPKEELDAAASSTTTTTPGETTTTTAPPADEGALGMVEGENAGGARPQQEDPTTTTTEDPNATTTTTAPAQEDPTEVTPREEDEADAQVTLLDKDGKTLYMLGPTLATGEVLSSAKASLTQSGSAWEVPLTMRGGKDGIDLFNELAAQCYNATNAEVCPTGQLAIVLDSVVQAAPQIQQPNYQADQIVINGGEGGFKESEAKDLALVLKYGSLPVELERQSVQTVSATLGEDSLRAGVIAGIVGLAIVAVYMVLYYRALGIVVICGLMVWGSLQYSIISWLGNTQGLALTLAGVTGIIVSVGVTSDSYIVFFERLKDEVRAGRTLRSSTERAFKRAFRTILAADVSAFIGASVLWWLTVGSVRGFAFFLGLSTILDVTVAWFFTRPVVTFLSRSKTFTEAPLLGVARGLAAPPTASAPAPAGGGR